jgi:hypothetical protein
MIENGELVFRPWWSRNRRVPLDKVDSLLLATVFSPNDRKPRPFLFALDKSGECIARMGASFFPETDIIALVKSAGIRATGTWSQPVSVDDLEAAHPGCADWRARRPDVFGLLFVGAICAVGLVAVLAIRFLARVFF